MAAWGRIRVLDGPIAGTVFFLDRPVLCLGRAAEADLRVPDATVSRKQAEIRHDAEGVLLVGLSDKNPLWLNGLPIQGPQRLRSGDKIQAGLVHFDFEAIEPRPHTTATIGSPIPAESAVTMLHGSSGIGAHAARADVRCPRCGAKEIPGARYCGHCGASLPATATGSFPTLRTAPGASAAASPPPPAHPPPPSRLRPTLPIPPPAPADAQMETMHVAEAPRAPKRARTETMGRPAEVVPHAAEAGLILKGRYELRRELGSGRATQVYAALDRARNLEVAIKVLRPEAAANRDARDQFFHSSNALVVAKHPNLLRVEEVHEEGEICFAVMELLPGLRLREQIRARPATAGGYPAAEARLVGSALCGALEALHAVGVHGNVRPENVWITPQGIVKLLDPGLLPPQGGTASWTGPGDLEAAFYSAPEVLQGKPPDAKSDQYSVAAVLYHMLAGEPAAGTVEPLRARRRELPDGLARAVDRGLSADPKERFPTLGEFTRAMATTGERTGPRRGLVVAGLAAAVLAGAASSVLWYPGARDAARGAVRDRAAEERAVTLKEEAAAAEARARGEGEFSDPGALALARAEREKGDAALADLRPAEAIVAFGDSKKAFDDETRAAKGRRGGRGKADAAASAWAEAERWREAAGQPVADLAGVPSARTPDGGPEDGGTEGSRAHRERKAAAKRTLELAQDLEKRWKASLTGPEMAKARETDENARRFQSEGSFPEAESEWRRATLLLHRAVAESRDALVQRALAEGRATTIDGMADARRKANEAALEGGAGDAVKAAERWKDAADAWARLLAPAVEIAAGRFLQDEMDLRCTVCAAVPGQCMVCAGAKREAQACSKCGGAGDLPASCAACAGGKTETCAECAGAKSVPGSCPKCSGTGKRLCSNCAGRSVDCRSCEGEGTRKCLRCKGTGKPTAMGEKAKCPDCDGTGSLTCPECKGEKTRVCTECGGTPESDCAACSASGKVTVPCPACSGSGLRPCAKCEGAGSVRVDCGACDGGRVMVDCAKCRGTGECPACRGRGSKE